MKQAKIVTVSVFCAAALFTQVAHAQEPTGLMDTFATGAFWIQLLITVVAGALGGAAYELLILQGNIERPHRPTADEFTKALDHAVVAHVYDLGIFARVFVGALAAVATWLVLTPDTAFQLVAIALVAGSAGSSVMLSMQSRLAAILAAQRAAEVQERADLQAAKVNQALVALERFKRDAVATAASVSASAAGGPAFAMDGRPAPNLQPLDDIQRLLSEAKGVHEAG